MYKSNEEKAKSYLLLAALVIFGIAVLLTWLFNDKTQGSKNSSYGAKKDCKVEWVNTNEIGDECFGELIPWLKVNPDIVFLFTPREFEQLIAFCFKSKGYKVLLTPQTKDGGKDIVVTEELANGDVRTYYVECKLYDKSRAVGVKCVREFHSVIITDGASQGLLIASTKFTKGAKEYLKKTGNIISLKDHIEILKWI